MRENPGKIRKKTNYSKYIEYIGKNDDFELKDTTGIKKYCVFNDLKYFHILDKFSVDIMHDINEGAIPFFLRKFYSYFISSKTLNLLQIRAKIRDFNYGILNKRNKPSKIICEKHNLGQNATQVYCIMIHTPFIFSEYEPKIPDHYWRAMENLLQIMQIIYSACISDADIQRLEHCIETFLTFLVDTLKENLTPKLHNMTHYPNVIKKMGPLVHSWMMRMEAKHKVFTDMVRQTNNFRNLPKTLAHRHQEYICNRTDSYSNQVKQSKSEYDITATKNYEPYRFCLPKNEKLNALKFLDCNSIQYRAGLMIIIKDDAIYEIIHIFRFKDNFVLLCHPYILVGFVSRFNSIEIRKDLSYAKSCMIPICDLRNKKTYEKIVMHDKYFIIADTLNVYNK